MLLPHAIAVTVPPTAAPVSLAEAKEHLLVEHAADDTLLSLLLKAATEHAERECGLYLMPQTVRVTFAEWDFAGLCRPGVSLGRQYAPAALELPLWPLRAVSSVTYLDADGVSRTWDAADWQADTAHRPPLIAPAYGSAWPTVRAGALQAVAVTCLVGAANAAGVSEAAKHAIKLIVAQTYANKGDGKDPTGDLGIPPAAKRFLDHLRQDFYR